MVQISIDGGGGFLKVIVNVFEEQEETEQYLNSGVQRSQFLAIIKDIPEKYENIKTIIELLRLDELKFYFAFDL